MIPKLSRTCYAIKSMSHISSTETLKSIYLAYFHSIMKCGIIFGVVSLLCRRELLKLFLVSNLGIYAEIYS
jgi:hypothetical protein